jgi:hypothetical protein
MVKYIEFDNQATLSRITVTVDDGPNCSVNLCYSNTAESARVVESILLTAISTKMRVKFNWDFGGYPTFYFRRITSMRQ